MKRDAFQLLHDMEDSWWYRGREAVIKTILARKIKEVPIQRALDFGAGYGGMRKTLQTLCSDIYAFEPNADARNVAETRGYTRMFSSAKEALAEQYSLIGLFDVVEHIQDDRAGIEDIRRALIPGGYVIITVPALPFLWSIHDVNHHHFRRYTKASIRELLEKNGYEISYISYWNTILFIPAAITRLMGHSGESTLTLPPLLNAFFLTLLQGEAFLLRFMTLPFGTGLVVVARNHIIHETIDRP